MCFHVTHLPETITSKEQAAVFPLLSMASQIITVCPIEKLASDGGSHVTETFPELSEAKGSSHLTIAAGVPSYIWINWSSTQIIVGASLSTMQNKCKCK